MYYNSYLQLDKILGAQHMASKEEGKIHAHQQMLFITIHQTYELWFQQILFEIDSILQIMGNKTLNDNSPQLLTVVSRVGRINTIMNVLVHQMDIMETMTAPDFLSFRDMLRPASGFQSWQFKVIEARLGLKFQQRYGLNYYLSQLSEQDRLKIKGAQEKPSVLELLNKWLERMPFLNDEYWEAQKTSDKHPFWQAYFKAYSESLSHEEKSNLQFFNRVLFGDKPLEEDAQLTPKACRNALFIMNYRGYPVLELPCALLEKLVETDNLFGTWRYRHINMVRKTIGSRMGTGGSTGSGYLQGAMNKHYIFREISQLNSFLLQTRRLPKLPTKLTQHLGFAN